MWLVVVGGFGVTEWRDVGRGVRRAFGIPVADSNTTMLIELGKELN